MKWWVLLLIPFQVFTQDTYNNCENLVKTYQVQYNSEKDYFWEVTGGEIILTYKNTVTIQWSKEVGQYKILAWTANYYCEGDTSEYYVSITNCPSGIFLPSSFTPNNDELNDIYKIKGDLVDEIYYMVIYDRWGGRIIEANNNILWDGNNCPNGVYSIVVFIGNKKHVKNITLIR